MMRCCPNDSHEALHEHCALVMRHELAPHLEEVSQLLRRCFVEANLLVELRARAQMRDHMLVHQLHVCVRMVIICACTNSARVSARASEGRRAG